MYQVGDRVRIIKKFEDAPVGTGVVKRLKHPLGNAKYEIQIQRDDLKNNSIYYSWWFPSSHIEHMELKYDPTQAGDKEDDI